MSTIVDVSLMPKDLLSSIEDTNFYSSVDSITSIQGGELVAAYSEDLDDKTNKEKRNGSHGRKSETNSYMEDRFEDQSI